MKLLRQLNQAVARIEGWVLSFCLLTMILLAFLQVVMRNLFDSGFVWADLVVRNLMLWVGFFGATLATSEGTHLTIDAVTKFLPEGLKRLSGVLVSVFTLVVSGCLVKASLDFVQMEKESGAEFLAGIPLWWTELILPATFILIAFHLLIRLVFQISGHVVETREPGTTLEEDEALP